MAYKWKGLKIRYSTYRKLRRAFHGKRGETMSEYFERVRKELERGDE